MIDRQQIGEQMIPDIGAMVGLYIITRMLNLVFKPDSSGAAKVMGWVTIVVAVIGTADLLIKGLTKAGPGF